MLPLAFGIGPKKHGGVVPDALGNDVDRDAAVEEQGRVGPPEVVEFKSGEPELLAALRELLAEGVRVTSGREGEIGALAGGLGKIRASSGRRMRLRSTAAPSGMPARSRWWVSRCLSIRDTDPSSKAIVRRPRQLLGGLYRMPNFFVTSRARSTLMVFSLHRSPTSETRESRSCAPRLPP